MCNRCDDLYSKYLAAQAAGDRQKAQVMYSLYLGCKSSCHPPKHDVVAVDDKQVVWPDGKRWTVR